jgi:hypothetical protein
MSTGCETQTGVKHRGHHKPEVTGVSGKERKSRWAPRDHGSLYQGRRVRPSLHRNHEFGFAQTPITGGA